MQNMREKRSRGELSSESESDRYLFLHISFAYQILEYISVLFACLFAALLIKHLSDIGVWISLILTEAATLCCMIGYIAHVIKRMPHGIEDFLLLDREFGETERFEISVGNDEKEVVQAADDAYVYGQKKGLDDQKNNAVRLMVEETGKNIVEHTFKKGKHVWFDIYILIRDNRVVMDFRDNGLKFNPLEFAGETDGYGLKLIRGLSKSMEYRYDFGLNALHIEL